MLNEIRTDSIRRAVSAFVAAGLMLGVATTHAQTPSLARQAVSAAQNTPQAPRQGPVLRLSMQEAETMAVETNLGLKQARLDIDIAAQNIASARSAFLPSLRSSFSKSASDSASQSFFESTSEVVTKGSVSGGATFSQLLPWYGSFYQAQWSASRSTTTAAFSSFNPQLGSSFSLTVVQPLLRNFKTDSNRARLQTSEMARHSTDLQVQEQILGTQALVRQAYLALIASNERRKVAQQNMDVAQESLRGAKSRVQVGAGAQIDVIQAEAAVASNEESVIVADADIAAAQDRIRALILDPARADYWQVQFEPTDAIQLNPKQIDVDAAIKNALEHRLDVLVLKDTIKTTDLNLKVLQNQTLPAVDAQVNYQAAGTGGTQFQYDTTAFPPLLLSQSTRGFGGVLGDTFTGALPSWSVGVSVAYPIGRTAAKAAAATTQLQREQVQIAMQNLQLQVASAVRQAARDVETAFRRVQATQTARQANEKQLDAEQRRFAVGLATTFDVLQKQSFLALARNSEVNAVIAYNQALIDFEKVQVIR